MTGRAGGTRTAEAIKAAAIDLFFTHGYESTTLRQIAAKVGIQVGSLYNHIPSKEDLLYSIMSGAMVDLTASLEAALKDRHGPIERLHASVECHVLFHVVRAREVFIGNSELRSLSRARRKSVVEMRDRYEATFRQIVDEGAEARLFHVADTQLITAGILAIGTQVSGWYKPRGRLSISEIASLYSDFVLRGLTNQTAYVAFGDVLRATS